jgi:hypothetical protein
VQAQPIRAQVVSGAPQGTAVTPATFELDTTIASLLHGLAGNRRRNELGHGPPAGKAYLMAVAITYMPLFVCALMSPLPVAARTSTLRLPFLYDWNVAFTFLVSFPSLLALTVTDQHALASSLRRVQVDGIVSIPEPTAIELSSRWCKRFRTINIGAQLIGVLIGLLLAVFNYVAFTPKAVGSWIASEGRLSLPAGPAFLCCIFLFYFLICVYVLRSVGMSMLLKDVVAHAEIRMLPFHPDRSGGLRPVGHLGLRNQYGLTVCGVNLVLLVFVYANNLTVPPFLYRLMAAAAIAYIILGPIVFLGPLLPFRAGMLRTKSELMSQIAQRLRVELERLRQQLEGGQITKDDEELIDRIRKVGVVVDELPVWPFDTGTLRKFLTAYVVPLLGAFGVKPLLELAGKWLHI